MLRLALLALTVLSATPVAAAQAQAQVAPPLARLAFVHQAAIWTMGADGSGRARVTRGGRAREPRWSPQGDLIAYTADGPGDTSAVWVVRPDGSGAHPVARRAGWSYDAPAWSPDGTRLALAATRLTDHSLVSAVLTVPREGGPERTVVRIRTGERLEGVGAPTWAPDGRRLAYTHSQLGREGTFTAEVRTVGEDGSGDARFLADAEGGAWSPDGSRFAYGDISDRRDTTCGSDECSVDAELAVVDAAGRGRRVLTDTPDDESDPSWSADGTRLAFSSSRNTPQTGVDDPEVHTIGADGSCLTWLTNGTPASSSPAWAPGPGSSAPAACGGGHRPALLETSIGRSGLRPLWLGPALGAGLLSGTQGPLVNYEDCSAFDPGDCPPAFLLTEAPACRDDDPTRFAVEALRDARRAGGALVGRFDGREDGRGLVLAGRTLVTVQVDSDATVAEQRRLYARVARALRPTPASARAAVGAPRLPARLLRRLPARLRAHVHAC